MTTSERSSEPESVDEAAIAAVNDERRRAVLRALAAADDQHLPFDDVVEVLAEHVDVGEESPEDRRRRLGIALHHVHLPRLEDVDLVDRPGEEQIRLTDEHRARQLLDRFESVE
ncbi:MAG: DUF7344 domain-containing protein [Halanaeroarchaeum sp.]